ncbi:MAG: sulfite exporter TauE/SafE family protein [Promethearchaeota archaeon]
MEFATQLIIILFFFGILSGFLASLTGTSGGTINVPILTVFFNIAIQEAIDTSVLIILITSSVALIIFLKQKRCNLKVALIFSAFSILGSFISSLIFSFYPLESAILKIIFSTLLIIIAINLILRDSFHRSQENQLEENSFQSQEANTLKKDLKRGLPFFILSGFVANLLGIGGGVVNTPVLNLIVGYPIHFSTATSTSIVFFTALFNTIIKMLFGQINYILGLILSLGGIIGSIAGAHVSNRISKRKLQVFVMIFLIFLAILMLFK